MRRPPAMATASTGNTARGPEYRARKPGATGFTTRRLSFLRRGNGGSEMVPTRRAGITANAPKEPAPDSRFPASVNQVLSPKSE